MVKLISHYTAHNIETTEWGGSELKVTSKNGHEYIEVLSNRTGSRFLVDEVFLYDNNNILLLYKKRENMVHDRYKLLMPYTNSMSYDEISIEVLDDNYRKVFIYKDEGRLVSLINEATGIQVFKPNKWTDIVGVYNDVLIAEFKDNNSSLLQSIIRYKQNLNGNELVAREIICIKDGLFKYRREKYFNLYNVANRKTSDIKVGYTDFKYISDQIIMGVLDNEQWDIINIHSMRVLYTTFEEPIINDDVISLKELTDDDKEVPIIINFSGTKITDGNEFDLNNKSGEVSPVSVQTDSSEHSISKVTIGRFVVVSDNSIKLSQQLNNIISTKSIERPCNINKGTICWLLLKENAIVITERNGISRYRRTILYKDNLSIEFNAFSFLAEKKWYIEDCSICSEGNSILSKIKDEIKSLLEKKVKSIEIENKTSVEIVKNDTKETIKLKAIYDFLQQQGFDKETIFKALYILFPSIEQYIDLTNVRTSSAELCKRIDNMSHTRDLISSDPNKLIEMLELNDKQRAILDYYTKVKGLSISTAIEYVNEESPDGTRVIAKYYELMRIGENLSNKRMILRQLILEDLIQGFVDMADTSDVLNPILTETSVNSQHQVCNNNIQTFEVDNSRMTQTIIIKEKAYEFQIDEIIPFSVFENKKVFNFRHDILYVQISKNIMIFLSKEKVKELDNKHSQIINLKGNGEDRRFSQVFTHINGAIKDQRKNQSRILAFVQNDEKTCRFFDELQYLDYSLEKEKNREIIMFKMRSMLRFADQ
jgi:hypothetical protein